MKYFSYFFSLLTCAALAIGNAMTELPTAKMFSNDLSGQIAFTLIIIGISCAMISFAQHASSPLLRRARDLLFCVYSVAASTIGIYAINSDASLQNTQRGSLISSLQSDIETLKHGANGLSPRDGSVACARTRWCDSQAKQAKVDAKTEQLAKLMANKTVTAFDALLPLSEAFDIKVEYIAFIFNAVRSLVCMYALLIMSDIARKQYLSVQGRADVSDIPQTKPRHRQTRRRQRFFSPKIASRQTKPVSVEDLVSYLSGRFDGQERATMRKIQALVKAYKGRTIDNNKAAAIAKRINDIKAA